MSNNENHTYKDTIKEAAESDDLRPLDRRKESEIAYEALAASTSMGMLGTMQETTELLELELASQLLYRFSDAPDNVES